MPLRRLVAVPLLLTALCVGLIWAVRLETGLDSHRFLLWNLFLAWIPALMSVSVYAFRQRSLALLGPLCAVWLVFLPNAPYLVTDLIHFGELNRAVPPWLDGATLLAAAAAGLSLGLLSLRYVHLALADRLGRWSWAPVSAAILASGVGVYLGRVLRLNSWDVAHPHRVASLLVPRLQAPQEHPLMLGGIGLCSFCLAASYLLFCSLARD